MAKRAAASFGIFIFSVLLIVLMQNCSNSSSSSPQVANVVLTAPQMVLSPTGATVTEGLSDTVYVSLNSSPSTPYSATLTPSDATLLNISPSTIIFNSSNWNVAQAVTVTAAHDADGADQTLNIEAAGAGLESVNFAITVIDDDICGDGALSGGEQCDDGNSVASDGCYSCRTTAGYFCNGAPSTCNTMCGDGIRVPSTEPCDDGDVQGGDGCSATCTVEPGYVCTGTTPSICRN